MSIEKLKSALLSPYGIQALNTPDIKEAIAEAEQLRERAAELEKRVEIRGELCRETLRSKKKTAAENDILRARVAELEFALNECVMDWDGDLPDDRRSNFIGRARKLIEANQIEGGE